MFFKCLHRRCHSRPQTPLSQNVYLKCLQNTYARLGQARNRKRYPMTHDEMEQLTAHTDVKSEKIRILYRRNVERTEIASFMGVQYQYVQSILKRSGLLEKPAKRVAETGPATPVYSIPVEVGGSIRLPEEYLEQAGIREGDPLVCRESREGLVLMSREAAAESLLRLARERMPAEAALFDPLLDPPTAD